MDDDFPSQLWARVLAEVQDRHPFLFPWIRSATPLAYDDCKLTLGFTTNLAIKFAMRSRKFLEGVVSALLGSPQTIHCEKLPLPEPPLESAAEVNNQCWSRQPGANNQGRVRSDNIAPYQKDGLLFRSQSEINFYDALKSRGMTFAPLPVFIRGGDTYRRIEPDFIIFQSGLLMVVELHGAPFHHETPVEAQERTNMFQWEGAHVQLIDASECDTPEKAEYIADQIQALFHKLLGNK